LKEWLKDHKAGVAAIIFLLSVFLYYFFPSTPKETFPLESEIPSGEVIEKQTEKKETPVSPPQKIIVDIKGAVNHPGVYEAKEGDRVIDVIERAGGLSENADETKVNLAQAVKDEMLLYIPQKGEDVPELPGTAGRNSESGLVNINTADEAELETLPGIGPAKSAAIIEYRKTNGGFKSVEELQSISGIGPKTFEKLKDKITVD
jgi:competence protein ComEA